jgi:FkbH-like protein
MGLSHSIAIAATFTAEPLADYLAFWMQALGVEPRIRFAPFNQVFQELLDPSGVLAQNSAGTNVLLVRWADWLRPAVGGRPQAPSAESVVGQIELLARELLSGLRAAAERWTSTCLVCLCPSGRAEGFEGSLDQACRRIENWLAQESGSVPGLALVTSQELAAAYPVADWHDPWAERAAGLPYKPEFLAALGTLLARKVHAAQQPPVKVIVADCDGTLWDGACGEEGAESVGLGAGRLAVQDFLCAQRQAGKLLCLCSKNRPQDVLAVFDQRGEMRLRREDFVAWRLNWRAKSENLRSLAGELQLGLDSFVFLDDNPLECAEVRANCPEVLVLPLPADPAAARRMLAHAWWFDQGPGSYEDSRRTELYRRQQAREELRWASPSLAEFVAGLQLQVHLAPLSAEQVSRVSQLTLRTNQFNLSGLRRSESEVRSLLLGPAKCLVAEARDRFGDYGLVGVLVFTVREESLQADSFLLSCRALGRGVEHRMLARLGEIAQELGLPRVTLIFRPSPRNQPAREFLESLRACRREEQPDGCRFVLPAH